MRPGPQIQCHGCGMPMLLAFAEAVDGAHRRLACPYCDHQHVWSIVELGTGTEDDGSQPSLGSSVE